MAQSLRPPRDVLQAMGRGFRGRCPKCAEGKLFRAFLKVADQCTVCGEEFSHHRADDAPAYFVILIVGHIVVALALEIEIVFAPPYWVHIALWIPLTLALALGLGALLPEHRGDGLEGHGSLQCLYRQRLTEFSLGFDLA